MENLNFKDFIYCTYCGSKIVRTASFCTQCGGNLNSSNHADNMDDTSDYIGEKEYTTDNNYNLDNNSSSYNYSHQSTKFYSYPRNYKNKWVSLALCFFTGILGGHKFYEEKYGIGILYLFTAGLFMFGVFIDFFKILAKPTYYEV